MSPGLRQILAIASIILCEMQLLIHAQTLSKPPLILDMDK